jgi:hypothetical protein
MGRQGTFASMAWNTKGKVTRREQFLAEMDAVIPWARLLRLIEPHYPKAGDGRQPLGLGPSYLCGAPSCETLQAKITMTGSLRLLASLLERERAACAETKAAIAEMLRFRWL